MRVRALVGGAALLAALSLGVTWSVAPGDAGVLTPGTTTLTNQFNPSTGELDLVPQFNPGFYFPGSPGSASTGYADDVRIGLVPAAAVLIAAALWPSRRTRRATAVATAALVICALWGFGHGLVRGPLLAAAAAALALAAVRRRSPTLAAGRAGAAPKRPTTEVAVISEGVAF